MDSTESADNQFLGGSIPDKTNAVFLGRLLPENGALSRCTGGFMTAAYLDDFRRALEGAGLSPAKSDLAADGCLHRFQVEGDKSGSHNGWFVFHLDPQPFGAFGSWKTGQSQTWQPERNQPLTLAERQALTRQMQAARTARNIEQAAVHEAARSRAAKLWARAKPAQNDHAYLARKQVGSFGLRDLRGQLVVPLRDANGILQSLQFIGPDGRKTFLTGGRKKGCYCAIGKPEHAICICEGYATGASIYQAAGLAVAVAFDAGNLMPVALSMRRKFPRLKLLICADDDSKTPGNPGLTAANAAAAAVRGAVAVPSFAEVANV